jgi:hypothetical protein
MHKVIYFKTAKWWRLKWMSTWLFYNIWMFVFFSYSFLFFSWFINIFNSNLMIIFERTIIRFLRLMLFWALFIIHFFNKSKWFLWNLIFNFNSHAFSSFRFSHSIGKRLSLISLLLRIL